MPALEIGQPYLPWEALAHLLSPALIDPVLLAPVDQQRFHHWLAGHQRLQCYFRNDSGLKVAEEEGIASVGQQHQRFYQLAHEFLLAVAAAHLLQPAHDQRGLAAAADGPQWRLVGQVEGPPELVEQRVEQVRAAVDLVLVVLFLSGDADGRQQH